MFISGASNFEHQMQCSKTTRCASLVLVQSYDLAKYHHTSVSNTKDLARGDSEVVVKR